MKKLILSTLALSFVFSAAGCSQATASQEIKLDPQDPTLVTVWHYYNGIQQQIFDELVNNFNETEGREKGIIIEASNKGNVNELNETVLSSARKEVGADPLPAVFAAYADCASEVDNLGLVADLSQYMSEEEINSYMDSYIQEGRFDGTDSLKLFPVAKSTEILLINETEWKSFEEETGADKELLKTWEGIVELSKEFYEWTDAKTPDVLNDGKAFYGRDAFANYMLIGSKQLGKELFHVENGEVTLQIDEDVMHKLWDCYYVPYVNGWFGAYGKFRSDDIKTGQLFALVGSTSGATYFPSEVTLDDGNTYPIDCGVYTLPNFEGTQPVAVQQGAGFVVSKTDAKTEYAASIFLKWITDSENNIRFAVSSGYLPVKKEANDETKLVEAVENDSDSALLKDILKTSVEVTTGYELYTPLPFRNGTEARNVVNYHMPDAATAAVAKRDQMIEEGMSREEAIATLTGEEAFEKWLSDFTKALEAAIAE